MEAEFVSLNILASLAGVVLLTTALVEATKYLLSKINIDPKWYALLWSFVLMMARQVFLLKDFSGEGWMLAFINWLIAFASAVGIFESIVKPIERKITEPA